MVKITVHDAEHWITVHPNGNKEEKGTPLLIEGSNGHYVVKGGAGGKLNGKTVNPKSMSKARKGTEGGGEPKGEEETPEWAKVKKPEPTPEAEKPHAAALEAEGFTKGKFDNFYRLQQNKENGAYHRLTVKPLQNKETGEWQYHLSLGGMSHTSLGLNGLPEVSKGSFKTVPELMQRIGELKNEYGFKAKEQPKPDAPKAAETPKATKVNVIHKPDSMFSPYRVQAMINGGKADVLLGFDEQQKQAGVVDAVQKFFEENGHKLTDPIGSSQIKMATNPQNALAACDDYLQKQLEVYGDASLPEDERLKSAKEAAERRSEREKQEKAQREEQKNAVLKRLEEKRAKREAELAKRRAITNRAPFTPANTVKEAKKWAEDNNLADHVDFGKLDVFVANAMNKSLSQHLELFPKLRDEVVAIGSGRAVMGFAHEYAKEKYIERTAQMYGDEAEARAERHVKKESTPRNCWAFAAPQRFGASSGVGFNESSGSNIDSLQEGLNRSVKTGFHPVGCDTVKSIMDHELGHSLDFMLGLSRDSEVIAIKHKAQYELGGIEKAVSGYAKKNMAEFIAESWSEYLNNPSPRPTALALGLLVRKRYAEKFGA